MLSVREEHISKRLSPTELNLLTSQVAGPDASSRYINDIGFFLTLKKNNKQFVICPMSKDAETATNEANIPFIGSVLQAFCEAHSNYNEILLIPMFMCRGYGKAPISIAGRQHAVLVEINLKEMTIDVHDSQGNIPWLFYPDKLSKVAINKFKYDSHTNYHTYCVQKDHFSCGFYVLEYIKQILSSETNSVDACKRQSEIKVTKKYLEDWGLDVNLNTYAQGMFTTLDLSEENTLLYFDVDQEGDVLVQSQSLQKWSLFSFENRGDLLIKESRIDPLMQTL